MPEVNLYIEDEPTIVIEVEDETGDINFSVEEGDYNTLIIEEVVVGERGKDNYEIWKEISGNENKTLQDFFDWLKGNKTNTKVVNEIPSGLINGINNIFITLNAFISESLEVFVNGVKQKIIDDYNVSGQNIILTHSLNVNENIVINYTKQ